MGPAPALPRPTRARTGRRAYGHRLFAGHPHPRSPGLDWTPTHISVGREPSVLAIALDTIEDVWECASEVGAMFPEAQVRHGYRGTTFFVYWPDLPVTAQQKGAMTERLMGGR